MESTHDLHTRSNGEYTLGRSLVHAAIIEVLFDGHERHDRAEVLFMAGGPASGKTTLRQHLALSEGAVVIDVDLIRAELPEYADLVARDPEAAADLTHEEASRVAVQAFAIGLLHGHWMVFDGVGADDEGQFSERVAATLGQGAIVRVCYATVPVDEARRRECARFEESRRRVPEVVLRAKHAAASRGFPNIAQLEVELIEVYEMSGPQPRLVARGPGGAGLDALEVIDAESYAEFLEKGQA
jgi:predicted kinase